MNQILPSKLILPLLLVVIILIVGGVFLLNRSPEPQPTPNPTPTQFPTPAPQPVAEVPEDWLTYRNDEFGFEVRYPKNYSYNEFKPNKRVMFLDSEGETSVSLTIFAKDSSFEQYLSEVDSIRYRSGSPEPKREEIFELQGMPARTQEFAYTTPPFYNVETFVEINPTSILLISTERDNNHVPIDESTRRFYNQILSTFRFVE